MSDREAVGRATAGWVQERLDGDLAYRTVITILTRLLSEGAVTREAGRPSSPDSTRTTSGCRVTCWVSPGTNGKTEALESAAGAVTALTEFAIELLLVYGPGSGAEADALSGGLVRSVPAVGTMSATRWRL